MSSHGHTHEHGEEENRKPQIIKLIISVVLFAAALLSEHAFGAPLAVYLFIYIASFAVVGFDVIVSAIKGIIHKDPFDECLLMTVASVGAFFTGSFGEAAAVMILYSLGEFLQDIAVDKSRDSISDLIDVVPKNAVVIREGNEVEIPAHDIENGDIIIVRPGGSVPADGVIVKGSASFDTSALTGESYPRDLTAGDGVLSGFLNINGEITVKATADYDNSSAVRIRELIEGASAKKAKTESFISKFARIYTPAVIVCALLIAVIPPLFDTQWRIWIHRALTFLVVSCPCALVISVPLTFFAGLGASSRKGILIKGAEHLETLSKIENIAFDKTGTLTKGTFAVSEIHAEQSEKELINTVCCAEAHSDHPIARAVSSLEYEKADVTDIQEIPGEGVVCKINGVTCAAGNRRLMSRYGIDVPETGLTAVYVCKNGVYLGYVLLKDELKDNAAESVKDLYSLGVKKTVMLTGDTETSAKTAANEADLTEYKAALLPGDKVKELENLLKEGKTAYVGDGINDAAVLARADVGVAMGALGSDAAIKAADVVLTDDNLNKLSQAVRTAKKTVRIAWQNIIFAIAVKLIVLILSALGIVDMMWLAVFADTGVALLCAANAMRAMK